MYFAVWLFLGSLFPQTDLEELCKVPVLLLHYQIKHADVSFSNFLSLHYGEEAKAHDCPLHDSLPMQHHAHNCQNIIFVKFEFDYQMPLPIVTAFLPPFNTFLQDLYQFQPDNTLFSPPKSRLA